MKKPAFKLVVLLMSLSLTTTAVTGCGGKKNDPTDSEKTATTSASGTNSPDNSTGDTTGAAQETSSTGASTGGKSQTTKRSLSGTAQTGDGALGGIVTDPNKIDFKGKKITISYWDKGSIPQKGKNEIADKQIARIEAAQKKYNFTFDYKVVSGDQYKTQFIATAASGKKFADIITHPTIWSYPMWMKNGYFAPLDDFVDYTNPKYKQMDGLTKYIDGNHYALCNPDAGPRVVAYNTQILSKYGCKDPLVMAQEGKWNWDAMLEIAKKTTVTEGGKVTQYGIGANYFTALLESNGVYQVKQESGKLKFGLNNPQALKTLNFFFELNTKYKVAELETPADLWKNFRDGKVAMQLGYLWEVGLNVVDRRSSVPYKIVPVPLGPDVKKRQIIQDNVLYTSFAPEKLTAPYKTSSLVTVYLDAFGTGDKSSPATYVDPYKAYSITNKRIFKTDEEKDFYWDTWQESEMHFGPTGGTAANEAGGLIWLNVMGPLQKGTEAPATLVAKHEKNIQAALDKLMK